MLDISKKKLFLLDMDGTLYIDDVLLPCAKEFVEAVEQKGGYCIFLTNNSSKGVKSYIEKMNSLGIKTSQKQYVTSVDGLIYYLKKTYGKKATKLCLYVAGTMSFKQQLIDEGFNVVDGLGDVDILVLGFDREITFEKLDRACMLLSTRKIDYLATNPDWVCPTSYGSVPDCGSFAWIIEKATGRKPIFIGKPEPILPRLAMEKTGISPEETVVIGDRLYTDIACGNNAGIDSYFVLSGEGTLDDLKTSETRPTRVFNSIKDILNEMNREEFTNEIR